MKKWGYILSSTGALHFYDSLDVHVFASSTLSRHGEGCTLLRYWLCFMCYRPKLQWLGLTSSHFEWIELPTKLLDCLLWRNDNNINQCAASMVCYFWGWRLVIWTNSVSAMSATSLPCGTTLRCFSVSAKSPARTTSRNVFISNPICVNVYVMNAYIHMDMWMFI